MKFRTEIEIPTYSSKINYDNSLFFMGSCFSANIGNKCIERGIDTLINPFGVTYNPLSISEILRYIEATDGIEDSMYRKVGDKWCSLMHHSLFDDPSLPLLKSRVSESIQQSRRHISKSSHLFITLGTAWVYEDLSTGRVVNNCHKIAEREFRRRQLSVSEIIDTFSNAIDKSPLLKEKNITFTVSPIRHLKDSLSGNSLSKATLRCAVDELCRKYPDRVSYFPAYEIMMDDLRDYRFYMSDMIHPSESAIEYLFEIFEKSFFTPATSDYGNKMLKISQAMSHIVIDKGSESHIRFKRTMIEHIEKIKNQYPLVDYSEKLCFFKQ